MKKSTFLKFLTSSLFSFLLFGLFTQSTLNRETNTFANVDYKPVAVGNKRIWFTNGPDASWWFGSGARTRISWWVGASYFDSGTNYMTLLNANGSYYYDIPNTATGLQFRRVAPNNNDIWNYSDSFSIGVDSEFYLYEVVDAQSGGGSAGGNNNNDKNVNKLNRFTAGNFENKIDDYFTCSNSIVNGYGDVPFLRMGFYDSMRQTEKNFFAASTRILHDFSYEAFVANGRSYTGLTQSAGSGVIPKLKWNAMESLYKANIDPSFPLLNL
jgi:hypothetical protein